MQGRNTKDLEQSLSACASADDYLEENAEQMFTLPVEDYLNEYLESHSLTRSEVIANSGLNEIYGYQIFAGKRKPSRDKLLCICFGMRLSADETQTLMKKCGYPTLYAKKRRDSVILYALMHEMTLMQCNESLYSAGEALLG